jgi:hypothetical protein
VGRALAIGVACATACRFAPHETQSNVPGNDAIVAPIDATTGLDGLDAAAPVGSACGGTLWHADFSVDPTTIDLNGDGVADFATRDGMPLGGTLGSGVWTAPALTPPLDTRPAQPFTTRVVIDVSMRDLTRGSGDHSAVMWLNSAYTQSMYAPLFLDLRRDSDSAAAQTWTMYGKIDTGGSDTVDDALQSDYVTDDGFHHFHIDIDPVGLTYDVTIDDYDEGTYHYYTIDRNGNADEWATVAALGGDSAFDDFQIEVCP